MADVLVFSTMAQINEEEVIDELTLAIEDRINERVENGIVHEDEEGKIDEKEKEEVINKLFREEKEEVDLREQGEERVLKKKIKLAKEILTDLKAAMPEKVGEKDCLENIDKNALELVEKKEDRNDYDVKEKEEVMDNFIEMIMTI